MFELNTKVNENSINHLLSKINYVSDTYLQNKNKYFVYIPDKNYYLNDEKIPKIEYNTIEGNLRNGLPSNYKWIDIKDLNNSPIKPEFLKEKLSLINETFEFIEEDNL